MQALCLIRAGIMCQTGAVLTGRAGRATICGIEVTASNNRQKQGWLWLVPPSNMI